MAYRSTRDCLRDLDRYGELIILEDEISPYLDIALLTRLVFARRGPALHFQNVQGSDYGVASNMFGTPERARWIFRKSYASVMHSIQFRSNPMSYLSCPRRWLACPSLIQAAWNALPRPVLGRASVMWKRISLSDLPQIVSWPEDGGAFLTLPQVMSMDPRSPSLLRSNLGMYRIQISGGEYVSDREVGLHYQLHRGIGIHHQAAVTLKDQGKLLDGWRVAIFIGGPPAHTFSAVMPMPENISEIFLAGMLAGRGVRWKSYDGYSVFADADFCILGRVMLSETKPEGPFGDHLGYYSLCHDFPYMKIDHVWARKHAVMPITVVGRPPQEDSILGSFIHRLSKPMVPVSIPGVRELHAVDDAGVHPLLLAIGSERYVPYQKRRPMEIITQAFAILGFNQCSLAKYLWIAAAEDDETLSTSNIQGFMMHVLSRIDYATDLHVLTRTTIDTLDYSSGELNFGSKCVITCAGDIKRTLTEDIPQTLDGVEAQCVVMPGVLAITLKNIEQQDGQAEHTAKHQIQRSMASMRESLWSEVALVVVCDDANSLKLDFRRFLWETFTRSHPADDLYGKNSRWHRKHWCFDGPLFIDARTKPHHTPILQNCAESFDRVRKYIAQNEKLSELFSNGV